MAIVRSRCVTSSSGIGRWACAQAVAQVEWVWTMPPISSNARYSARCVGVSVDGFREPSTTSPSSRPTSTTSDAFNASYETPDGLGYAHFQEHMLFKGTDTFGPGYIDRVVEGQGGRDNAFTSFDYTTFQILVPSDGIRAALELLEAMAFRSTFDPKEIEAERQVIFEEARIETDNPKSAIVRQPTGVGTGVSR